MLEGALRHDETGLELSSGERAGNSSLEIRRGCSVRLSFYHIKHRILVFCRRRTARHWRLTTQISQPQENVTCICRVLESAFPGQDASSDHLLNNTIKRLHSFLITLFHGIDQ